MSDNKPLGLVKNLCEIMAAIERVPKNGTNKFHNYSYVTESDLVDVIRKELSKRNVFIFPNVTNCVRSPLAVESKNGVRHTQLTEISVDWTFVDGETGETHTCRIDGVGEDNVDKGFYKAFTGSEKYMLMKSFLVATGDDPEKDSYQPDGTKEAAQAVGNEKRAALAKVSVCHSPDETLFIYGSGVALIDTVLRSTGTKDLNGMWSVPAKDAQSVIQACIEKSIEVNEVPYAGQAKAQPKSTAGINVPPIPPPAKEDPIAGDPDLRCVRYMQRNGSYVLTGHTYGIKDEIKALKGRFDKPKKEWSIPTDMLGALKNICDEKGIELEGIA